MDDIMSLKNKHMNNTDSQIKELLEKKIKLIDQVKNKQNQQRSGNCIVFACVISFLCVNESVFLLSRR